ncbi:beta-galactosidase [Desmospora activa]|uniref:Beta-galactosidase n=1 Tax=Desmospora activa DSM 45169 TaxID=1121389 RepID=A0A2T4ZAZ4_9BACL|nr:beta-galactosidase [Desmospora activa]PTM59064.1 beta-galactosidase [Desmospora activa DSM 45169]
MKSFQTSDFRLGVCYYPEHWPEKLWSDDYRRMREMGFSVVRMAEFAWSIFEPREGEFQYDLFDRAIDLAHEHGLQVILGTPTATPPAWLTHRYPEVLNVSQEGIQYQHGQRRHYNYNAPVYRELSARIVRKMVAHYRDHPAVIGWQIDNELNCEIDVFYSEADHQAFRQWLKGQYGSLDRLNEAWGTVFWNQTYTEWEQVHLIRPTVSDSPNPHQALDEKRFFSDSAISFAKLQADIIRETAPNHFVTTNGIFGHLDSHRMTDELLDFISFDSYPNFSTLFPDEGEEPLLDRKWSWNLSIVRSISPHFCIMEQQSGPGGWVNRIEQPSPKPGQMRLWTYQSIAHGADMVLYFRWRTAPMGTEIYWHGINDVHNRPNRRLKEASQVGEELQKVGRSLVGKNVKAEVAIVKDYDNEWDGELDNWHGPYEKTSVQSWFKAFQYNHIPVDALFLKKGITLEELRKYKLLVYPHPTILSDETAHLLTEYVRSGGQLILGCRSGYKNSSGICEVRPFPGPIAELCGVTVEDFTRIGPYEQPPRVEWWHGENVTTMAEGFNDILYIDSPSAEILATYQDGYYQGKPALVRNEFGSGTSYYYGAVFNEETADCFINLLGLKSPTADWLILPKEVELSIRRDDSTGETIIFLLNYAADSRTIHLNRKSKDLLTDQVHFGSTTIAPYGTLLLDGSTKQSLT